MLGQRGVLATLMDRRNREKIIVEDVERGDRHQRRRKSRTRTRERSPSPIESTGSSAIVEDRRKSKHRSSRNHHIKHSRHGRHREIEDDQQSRNQSAPVRMPSPPPGRSHTSSVRRPRENQAPTNQPTAPMPLEPAHVTTSRDLFYSPRLRDFPGATPRVGITRPRDGSPNRDREPRRDRRTAPHDNIITVEADEDSPPPRERRRRRRRSMGEERIEREDGGRERRRQERSIDSYKRRQSLSEPAPRKLPAKQQKKSVLLENAKWLALLPLALRAIHIVAEPNGGWEQFFRSEDPKEKKKKQTRSSRPDPQQQCLIQQDRDRHQERWSARSGGPYPEDPKGRSSSDYSEPRSHASSPLKPRRHEAPPLEEQFQRRRPRRQHHRIREERSPGLSEAASEDVSAHQRMNSEQQLSVWAPMEVLPKKIRHSRRSEPPVRSNMVESEKPQRLEDGKIHGRGSMEHFISKSRPLKISSRFDTASTDTVVG